MSVQVAAIPKFEFIEETQTESHIYLLDGKRLPSVTQVLEDCGVIDYSRISGETREMALKRGRYVHLLTQYWDERDLDESTVKPEWKGYLEAWKRFCSNSMFFCDDDGIEHRDYHNQYRYAGTLDRTGTFYGHKFKVLIDIKTNHAEWWTRLQTAAYAAFMPDPRSYLRMAVELHEDGTFRTGGDLEFPGKTFDADFQAFLNCLSVFNLKRRYQR